MALRATLTKVPPNSQITCINTLRALYVNQHFIKLLETNADSGALEYSAPTEEELHPPKKMEFHILHKMQFLDGFQRQPLDDTALVYKSMGDDDLKSERKYHSLLMKGSPTHNQNWKIQCSKGWIQEHPKTPHVSNKGRLNSISKKWPNTSPPPLLPKS